MTKKEIKNIIDPIHEKLVSRKQQLSDEEIYQLFNVIESISNDLDDCQDVIKKYEATIDKLKGEKPNPQFNSSNQSQSEDNKNQESSSDHSSEKERRARQPKKPRERKSKRKASLVIHRQEYCQIDTSTLPGDAIFKGYKSFN